MRLIRFSTTASLLLLAAAGAAAQPAPGPPPAPPLARLAGLYQGRRPQDQQTDRVSRKIRLGRNGRVSVANISGDIVVSAGSGDEVTIDAVKRGNRNDMDRVRIVIDDRAGRVDIVTEYDQTFGRRNNNSVDVDYTVTVPDDASIDLKSISGEITVKGVKGSVRAQSVSGDVTTSNAPRVESARSVSGSIGLSGVSHDGDLSVQCISGTMRVNGVKTRSLDANTVSGDIILQSANVERLNARLTSGVFEYTGALARNGRYEVNNHSGDVRFTLTDNTGFELSATTFSGEIRSNVPLTLGGRNGNDVIVGGRGRGRGRVGPGESVNGTAGDGSARLDLRVFSGSIVISKR